MDAVAPSDELRRFFGHDPAQCQLFRKRYLAELESVEIAQPVAELIELARKGKLTLVYGAKDQLHMQSFLRNYSTRNCRAVD